MGLDSILVSETKRCSKCREELPLNKFHKNRAQKYGVEHYCKECKSQYSKKRYREDWDRTIQRDREYRKKNWGKLRQYRLKTAYGITPEQHKQMYLGQDGRCAICEDLVPYGKIHTDHNHETGKVRALLCRRCNMGIGMFGDTLEGALKVVEYLRRF